MASERERRIDALLDKQDILECLARFSRGMDRFDRETYLFGILAFRHSGPTRRWPLAPLWAALPTLGLGRADA